MKSKVGLWIDHRKAVIVTITDKGEEISTINSQMEKHVRFSGEAAEGGAGEDVRDRGFGNHLAAYYDKVIAYLREAESILIFGPGEAKGELEARLTKEGHKGPTVSVETTDKMTDPQIAEKVRQHFSKVG
jgi:stalled ribosome rescue protein Dom34